ncbi:D-gluconate kinase [compost metagenome]
MHLTGSHELLAARAAARAGHFMPASLLDSQLRTLEPLEADERGTAVDVAGSVDEIAGEAADWVRAGDA